MENKQLKKLILNKIKKSKTSKTNQNKLFLNMIKLFIFIKKSFSGIFNKFLNMARSRTANELSLPMKDILLHSLIIYPVYHLLFMRSSIVLTVIGCGALYYLFRDSFEFIIETTSEGLRKAGFARGNK